MGQSKFENLLTLVYWSMRKLRVYVQFAASTICLPDASYTKVIKDTKVHTSVRAKLLDLSLYPHSFLVGKPAWVYGAEYIS